MPPREELLESEDLPAVPQRISGEEAKLGQGVEHHPNGIHPLYSLEDRLGRTRELHLRWVEDGVLGVGPERFLVRHQLENLDTAERPPVGTRNHLQLGSALGQRHVQALLAAESSLKEELESECGLSRTWIAFDQKHVVGGIASTHDTVEAGNPRQALAGGWVIGRRPLAKGVGHQERSSSLVSDL